MYFWIWFVGKKTKRKGWRAKFRQRRVELTDKFVQKCFASDKFKSWFPNRVGRAGRNSEKYLEEYAKCDQLRNLPIFYMRRRLNGKDGKIYGERIREYRE